MGGKEKELDRMTGARNMAVIRIRNRSIGSGERPYVIAEAGVHHYNSMELARQYTLAARIAGADAIKWQAYTAAKLAARWAPVYWAEKDGTTQFDVFLARSQFSAAQYSELAEYSASIGIDFLCTPFDSEAVRDLNDVGMRAFKIASADLTNLPLLVDVARCGKPVLLSTGASTMAEIQTAVDLLQAESVPYALLHCNLSYPTLLADANLARIQVLAREFPNTVVGYSDHTRPQDSEIACPLSVALGACILEKHFTLNKLLRGDDHDHAVDAAQLARLVKNCVEAAEMCQYRGEMSASEGPARTYARRSIVAACDIATGTVLTHDHLAYKRPGTGIPPGDAPLLLGKMTRRAIVADELLLREMVE
jgi:N-acetylneuraminate synthase